MKIKAADFESKVQSPKLKVGSSKFEVQSSKSEAGEIRGSGLDVSRIVGVGLVVLALLNFACVNQSLLKKNKNDTAIVVDNNASEYERDLGTMKTANFDFIFAFRRRDAAVFDAEDKKFLRANTPPGTNRFVSTDEGRAFIAGSRYAFSSENLEALQSRFLVEDYSKPEQQRAAQNTNQNTNANR